MPRVLDFLLFPLHLAARVIFVFGILAFMVLAVVWGCLRWLYDAMMDN